jgi:hypothetical protein
MRYPPSSPTSSISERLIPTVAPEVASSVLVGPGVASSDSMATTKMVGSIMRHEETRFSARRKPCPILQ